MNVSSITADSNHAGVTQFRGFSVREDAAAAAVIRFRHGSASGDILWELGLAASQSAGIVLSKDARILTPNGVYVEEVSGSIVGVLFGA